MRLNTNQFDINVLRKTFVEEMSSTLGNQGWTQIYPDACDAGVILTSHKTGLESSWYIHEIDYDYGGEDIMGWRLLPTPESLRKYPRLKGWTMLIIND